MRAIARAPIERVPSCSGASTRARTPSASSPASSGYRVLGDVLAVDRPPVLDHGLEDLARHRDRRARLQIVLGADARGRHHAGAASLGEQDRRAVERQQAAQLAHERGKRPLEVERRAERARCAVGRLEQVDPAAELVAQALRLRGPLLGVVRLAALHVDEPPDDRAERHGDDDPEHERVVPDGNVELVVPPETRGRAGPETSTAPAINPPARRKKSAASSTTRNWSDRRGWAGSHANDEHQGRR